MGFVLSKFRKKKPSIKESLEKIDKELKGIQRFQVDTEIQQKRIIGRLTLFAFVAFTIASVAYYFFGPQNQSWKERLLWIVPYIVFPILIWSLRKLLAWWYQQKIVKNREKSETLRKDKEQLLEDVMEKETFKVAKEILEKYAPRHLLPKYLEEQQRSSPTPVGRNTPLTSRGGRMSTGGIQDFSEGLRRRGAQSTPNQQGGFLGPRSMTPGPQIRFGQPGPFPRMQMQMRPAIMPPPGAGLGQGTPQFRGPLPSMSSMPTGFTPMRYMLPLPPSNPIIQNRKTGWLDKLVDYVVGDGPGCRYALICRYCATHNGLATPEDFPYQSYRCVYCRQYNPSKEQRPSAATLPRNTVLIEEMESTIKSEEEEGTSINEEDSEVEGSGKDERNKDEKTLEGGEETEQEARRRVSVEAGDEETEPLVEFVGSTNDLSSRKSTTEENDPEEKENIEEDIPYADEMDDDNDDYVRVESISDTENVVSLSESGKESISINELKGSPKKTSQEEKQSLGESES